MILLFFLSGFLSIHFFAFCWFVENNKQVFSWLFLILLWFEKIGEWVTLCPTHDVGQSCFLGKKNHHWQSQCVFLWDGVFLAQTVSA